MMAVGMAALASFPVAQSFSHIVGGPAGWTFGSNYAGWANITAAEPGFFNNDVLLFKYENEPPIHHDVYLFKDFAHYQACDFSEATLLANSTQGQAAGFEYKLPERGWYHFGCSVPSHCTDGLMKFRIKAKHHSKPRV